MSAAAGPVEKGAAVAAAAAVDTGAVLEHKVEAASEGARTRAQERV